MDIKRQIKATIQQINMLTKDIEYLLTLVENNVSYYYEVGIAYHNRDKAISYLNTLKNSKV